MTNICASAAPMQDAWVTCSATGKLFKARWLAARPEAELHMPGYFYPPDRGRGSLSHAAWPTPGKTRPGAPQ